MKARLAQCGGNAKIGESASAAAFKEIIGSPVVMGTDLYAFGPAGARLEALVGKMLTGKGAVLSALLPTVATGSSWLWHWGSGPDLSRLWPAR